MDLLDRAIAFRAQHVLHLHRLDHSERLAGLDLLPFANRNGHHEPRHRAQQFLAGIGRSRDRHQPRGSRFRLGEDIDRDLHSLMGEPNAVGNGPHLHRHDLPVDGALPDHFTRRPR